MALSTQLVRSSSSFPSSSTLPSSYDAFISFCGVDTRNGFVDHLYADFQRKGLIVFKDDKRLERGKLIGDELLEAIKQSQYAVVVISENFAFSKWCLIELDKIVEYETEKRLKILPVFYRIDPSEVRKQKGFFAQAFAKHREDPEVSEEQRGAWSAALKKVSNIAGWHVQPIISAEAIVVKDIIGTILRGVKSNSSKSLKGLVGIGSRVKELEKELCLGMDGVRLIGIYGMAGIGKTTLAKALFRKVRYEFEESCFVCCGDNKRICELLEQIIHQILGENNLKIWDPISGIELLETRLQNRKIFIALDDMDRDQLEQLLGNTDWLGQGSRIIVTGKDRQLLKLYVNKTYEVGPLGYKDALELFCQKAFKNSCLKSGYLDLVENIMRQVNGHPLAIVVIGSSLFGKGEREWIGARDVLEADTNDEIFTKLEISYRMLGNSLKKYFLDIACFGGWFVDILKLFDLSTSLHIGALEDKSLINTSRFGKVVMHDLLRKLGQQVVCQMSPWDLGNRSRLWVAKDIIHVLRNDSGTKAIEGIVMENIIWGHYSHYGKHPQGMDVKYESFSRITRLTVLILGFNEFFYLRWIGNPSKLVLSNELHVIQWMGFPLKSLPDSFQSNILVKLCLRHSNIKVLWIGNKSFAHLKIIDLCYSKYLTEIPDLSGVPNLEELRLKYCEQLRKIHPSITNLGKLVELDLGGCRRLRDDVTFLLPLDSRNSGIRTLQLSSQKSLSSFREPYLSSCSNLSGRPIDFDWLFKTDPSYSRELIGSHPHSWLSALTSLTKLDLSGCNLSDGDIPSDISYLSLLEDLILSDNEFTRIPEGIAQLSNLKYLSMRRCEFQCLTTLPPPCLSWTSHLDLSRNKCTPLPDNFLLPSKLIRLNLEYCRRLRTLSKFPLSLRDLMVEGCSLDMDYYQTDVRKLASCNSVWFSVAANTSCDGIPYKILQLNEHLLIHHLWYCSFGGMFAWGPTLGFEIPRWFNHRSINLFKKIQCRVDVDLQYSKKGLALFVAYQVHEQENSNCSISRGTNSMVPEFVCRFQASDIYEEFSLVFRVPEVPFVGPNGFWAYIPAQLFKENRRKLYYCGSLQTSIETSNLNVDLETSIETSNLNVEVKECGIRLVYEHNVLEFLNVLNSITPHGLELKSLQDFDFDVAGGENLD